MLLIKQKETSIKMDYILNKSGPKSMMYFMDANRPIPKKQKSIVQNLASQLILHSLFVASFSNKNKGLTGHEK